MMAKLNVVALIIAPLTLMLRTSSSADSSISAAQIAVKYDRLDDGDDQFVEKLSRSQKIVKSQKTLVPLPQCSRQAN